ncbi:unnamed protein product [Pleuronectes platessa]|uniref:Uncharacterized protein n=1 Tax=Pleuronectes platessa TaxID=8262 RepID=A0A9N7VC70_PLEPL|nr:unnamed protein product [Pleuronectes platessa]
MSFEKSTSNLDPPRATEGEKEDAAKMFSTKRLKKKSQSVDIASQGFSPTLVPASPLNKAAPPVAAVLAVQENNTTNSQRRSPRCGELKRGYTIVNERRGGRDGVNSERRDGEIKSNPSRSDSSTRSHAMVPLPAELLVCVEISPSLLALAPFPPRVSITV